MPLAVDHGYAVLDVTGDGPLITALGKAGLLPIAARRGRDVPGNGFATGTRRGSLRVFEHDNGNRRTFRRQYNS
jgi:hypothetical protein